MSPTSEITPSSPTPEITRSSPTSEITRSSPADVAISNEVRIAVDKVLEEVEKNEQESIEKEKVEPKPSARTAKPQPPFGVSYQEIKNLVWAKKHPVISVALDEWDRKERLGSSRVDRREKRSADLINQIFNLVGFYSVFQGVVLTAVTQLLSSGTACKSLCGKVWVPALLTVVAAAVTIIAVLEKFRNLKKLEKSIFSERRVQGEAVRRGQAVRVEGLDFRFHRCKALNYTKSKSFWKNKIGVIVSLVVFTLIFILAYVVILCDVGVVSRWNRRGI